MNARAWQYQPFQAVPRVATRTPRGSAREDVRKATADARRSPRDAVLKPHPHKPRLFTAAGPRPVDRPQRRSPRFDLCGLAPTLPTATDLTPNVDVLLGLPAEASMVVREANLRAREADAREYRR